MRVVNPVIIVTYRSQSSRFSINNLGDPFIESNYGVHSRLFEIEVLDFFASAWEIDREDYWGAFRGYVYTLS